MSDITILRAVSEKNEKSLHSLLYEKSSSSPPRTTTESAFRHLSADFTQVRPARDSVRSCKSSLFISKAKVAGPEWGSRWSTSSQPLSSFQCPPGGDSGLDSTGPGSTPHQSDFPTQSESSLRATVQLV